MDRKRRISGIILSAAAAVMAAGCSTEDTGEKGIASISLTCSTPAVKAIIPQEDAINDINLVLFENGRAETAIWKEGLGGGPRADIDISFIKGRKYSLFVLANAGKKITLKDTAVLNGLNIELADGEGFANGIPMSAMIEDISFDGQKRLDVTLVRQAARISLRIDRSRLSKNVRMDVKAVRVGNFPRYAKVMGPSRVTSVYDRFEEGFVLTADQCQALNETGMGGISGEASVYMLENMQGTFPGRISEDEEKVFDEDDPLYDLCSYLELEMDYRSADLISYDSPLLYRFYLGDGLRSLDVERNCHYHITVIPEDDGLSGGGWRVDKSGIGPSTPLFKMHPGNYVEGHVGDTLRIWCECYPKTAPFDPGYEELNYDKSRGIYDYAVDDDGHGVTLYLKKAGTGIVYMSAGAPINQSGMVIVYVNP